MEEEQTEDETRVAASLIVRNVVDESLAVRRIGPDGVVARAGEMMSAISAVSAFRDLWVAGVLCCADLTGDVPESLFGIPTLPVFGKSLGVDKWEDAVMLRFSFIPDVRTMKDVDEVLSLGTSPALNGSRQKSSVGLFRGSLSCVWDAGGSSAEPDRFGEVMSVPPGILRKLESEPPESARIAFRDYFRSL